MNGHFIYRNKGDVLIRACFRCAAHLVYEVLQMPELVEYVSPQKIRFALLSMRWVCVVALTNPTPKFTSRICERKSQTKWAPKLKHCSILSSKPVQLTRRQRHHRDVGKCNEQDAAEIVSWSHSPVRRASSLKPTGTRIPVPHAAGRSFSVKTTWKR